MEQNKKRTSYTITTNAITLYAFSTDCAKD